MGFDSTFDSTGPKSELPLRGHGPLVDPFVNGFPKIHPERKDPLPILKDPPRALKSLAQIIDNGLCHRCGSCVGICPTGVLSFSDDEYPVVKNLSACTDCDLCVKICPGDEFNAGEVSQQMFGKVSEPEDIYGEFQGAYLTHATDPEIRKLSTSGGLVSAMMISLLELGTVDGCVVVTSDENVLYKGVAKIARTREEILEAMKSKYAIVPTNAVFQQILELPGRYAFVGLPCQIHGFYKGAKLDQRLRERIVFTIALICHAAIEHTPLKIMYERLGEAKKDVSSFIYRHGKHAGTSHVKTKDGHYRPVMFPTKKGYQPDAIEMMNILYRLYTPERCLTCYDAMGEFADMAVGDPWMPKPFDDINFHDGYTYAINRTPRAEAAMKDAVEHGYLVARKLSDKVARTSNYAMGVEKRYRAFRMIEARRRLGFAVPDYHFKFPAPSLKHRILTEINVITHIFCFLPKIADHIFRFALSDIGYGAFWLNNKRRRLRTWRRNLVAKLQRGREEVVRTEDDEKKW